MVAVGAERAAVQGSRLDDEAVVRFGHVAAESIDLGGERFEAIGLVAAQVCAAPVEGLRIAWTIAHSRERTLSRAGSELARLLREQASEAVRGGRWPSAELVEPTPPD